MTIHTEPEEDVSTDIKTETAFFCKLDIGLY